MNVTKLITWERYAARLLALVLGWLVTSLATQGMTLSKLASQGSLIALIVLIAGFLLHVAQSFADTGDVPAVPPVSAPAPPLIVTNSAGVPVEPPA